MKGDYVFVRRVELQLQMYSGGDASELAQGVSSHDRAVADPQCRIRNGTFTVRNSSEVCPFKVTNRSSRPKDQITKPLIPKRSVS